MSQAYPFFQERHEIAERARTREAQDALYDAENRELARQHAAERAHLVARGHEAMRLLRDEALWGFMKGLREQEAELAICAEDHETRERARMLCRAIDRLYAEIKDRIETASKINEEDALAYRHE